MLVDVPEPLSELIVHVRRPANRPTCTPTRTAAFVVIQGWLISRLCHTPAHVHPARSNDVCKLLAVRHVVHMQLQFAAAVQQRGLQRVAGPLCS